MDLLRFLSAKKYTREDKFKLRKYYRRKKRELFLKECSIKLPRINKLLRRAEREQGEFANNSRFIDELNEIKGMINEIKKDKYLLDEEKDRNVIEKISSYKERFRSIRYNITQEMEIEEDNEENVVNDNCWDDSENDNEEEEGEN